MTEDPRDVLLLARIDEPVDCVAFAARCHSGTLRVGDEVRSVTDPNGNRHEVSLRVAEIRLTETQVVEELAENWGGLVALVGSDASVLDVDWHLG